MGEFIVLLIFHLIGDFYLQTTKVARCKNAKIGDHCGKCKKCKKGSWINPKYLMLHAGLYVLPFCVLPMIIETKCVWILLAVLFFSHGLIDTISCYFNKKIKNTIVFLIDQATHLGILYIISLHVTLSGGVDIYYNRIKFICMVLLIMMPSSIFINILISDIYPDEKEKGLFDIGSMIGIMERLLTIIFSSVNNFSAIAIIITVKTWARNNDLKEGDFRNKYLLGTLSSLVVALLIYILYQYL